MNNYELWFYVCENVVKVEQFRCYKIIFDNEKGIENVFRVWDFRNLKRNYRNNFKKLNFFKCFLIK